MTKNLFFSIIVLIASITAKAQYKNAVSVDPFSYWGTVGLEYERFVFSENNHHISVRGIFGYTIPVGKLGLGAEVLYGFGRNHRFELGLGGNHLLGKFPGGSSENEKSYYANMFSLRVGYAYFAKENPMFYRVGFMPFNINYYGGYKDNTNLLGLTIGVGYRF
ncbi:MAG: hypothetical protein JJU02_03320 [Cryomorphaceae bacterium]|nr:hypothetical protein [Cryomorphaceae bacterium]